MAAFEIRDLSFTYPNENKPALDSITLSIPEGRITLICGASGSGKTLITCGILCAVLPTAPQLVAFFNQKPEVVQAGTLFLRYLSPFYVLCCFNQVYAAALRGAGNSKATMIIMLCSFVLFRQVYLFIMSHYISHELIPLVMGYPAGWLVCSAATLIYYRRTSFLSTRLVAEDGSKEDIQ